MSDVLANAARDKPSFSTMLKFPAAHDLDVKEVQAWARVDKNGRTEQENRRQPRGRRAVQNGPAPLPSQENRWLLSWWTKTGWLREAVNGAPARMPQMGEQWSRTTELSRKSIP
jgi:hypothetical protein